jgi:hypothetical protein
MRIILNNFKSMNLTYINKLIIVDQRILHLSSWKVQT